MELYQLYAQLNLLSKKKMDIFKKKIQSTQHIVNANSFLCHSHGIFNVYHNMLKIGDDNMDRGRKLTTPN